tara:strand:- start:2396 stop:2980 length:585 start_codon:yes stop_codon:yes gene_type:complete
MTFDYKQHVRKPNELGAGKGGSVSTMLRDVNAFQYYMDWLNKGPPVGENYFFQSGTCGPKSSLICRGQPRWIYVRNIPTGRISCTNTKYKNIRGIIPGLFEDVDDIDFIPTINNFNGKGSAVNDKCVLRKALVGNAGKQYYIRKCSPPDTYPKCYLELFNSKPKPSSFFSSRNLSLIIIVLFIFLIIKFFKSSN